MSSINDIQMQFKKMGEFYAAGFYEEPDKPLFIRYARALRRCFENYKLNPYNGEPLYPVGAKARYPLVNHSYSYTVEVNWKRLAEAAPELSEKLRKDLGDYRNIIPSEHTVGGNMYIHSYPNFARIILEGLDSYEERVLKIADEDVRDGLIDLLLGIRNYHARVLELLKSEAPGSDLYRALLKVPFAPAENLYEALVAWNFVYYLDGCDDVGAIDTDLIGLYKGEDVIDVLRCFFRHVDTNNGWSGTLGPDYNPLTLQCLRAIKGFRRPSLELRVTRDMPDEIWDAALDAIRAGGGSPSLYNEAGYQSALERIFPEIPKQDRMRFAGGGCTETMIAGLSNVGSRAAGINDALIFERSMRAHLPTAASFEDFYSAFIEECRSETLRVLNSICEAERLRAEIRPHPMRTLLVDDCIENGKDFNNGGARYYWSVVNLAGMINVLDSLLVIDSLVFADRVYSGEGLLGLLDEGENFLRYTDVPRHGTDSEKATAMARRLSIDLTKPFSEVTPYFGGAFLPSSIQFTTYVNAGRGVGATPDGRAAGAPLCDSIGAIHGNDKFGMTALLNGAASLSQKDMCGTPILNVKLDRTWINNNVKALVLGYFANGGMQLQVTCVNREDLIRAKEHPEKYPNLVVRIGGYSEYFCRLSSELQQTVIDRTEYGG